MLPLRAKLRTEGGEVVCTTIEKFSLKEGKTEHPSLTHRHNVLVIADEAHRTQYGLETSLRRDKEGKLRLGQGFARNLRQALPQAAFLGFTGTPIDKEDANTIQLFGDYIHVYDMQQAREDEAVVQILYEARHIPLDLQNEQIDTDLEAIGEEFEVEAGQLEEAKAKWAVVEKAAGAQERLVILARDLLDHFNTRQQALNGKAMIVCMSRRNCVTLYDALQAQPDCPPVKIVMTGNLAADPAEWSQAGHITTKAGREAIKKEFIDPDHSLKLVIVCDMWLTGFDAPCVNTMYVDKLMKGHNLMQAIARVNRIFRDKQGGLIVDYIGIGDRLKEATRKYTSGGGRGALTDELQDQALVYFLHQVEVTRSNMPEPAAQPAFDVFARAGFDKPEVSILDEEFLAGFRQAENQDLQMRLLLKLLQDELYRGRRQNIIRYRSFKAMLDEALHRYNSRIIEAEEVVEIIRQIQQQVRTDQERQARLGLNDEELAFFDVITLGNGIKLHQSDDWIADLVRQVVVAVRNNLEVDWTKPHRSNVEAAVTSAVGRVLRKNKIKGEQFAFLRARLMKQAKASYEDWPMVA